MNVSVVGEKNSSKHEIIVEADGDVKWRDAAVLLKYLVRVGAV